MALLRASVSIQIFFLQIEEALETGAHYAELAESLGHNLEAAVAHLNLVSLRYYLGEIDAAERHSVVARAFAEKARFHYSVASATVFQAVLALACGRWDDASSSVARGLEVAPADGRVFWFRAQLELETGRFEAARSTIARLFELASPSNHGLVEAAAIVVGCMGATHGASDEWLEPALGLGAGFAGTQVTPLVRGVASTGAALLAVVRHDPELAQLARVGLAPFAGRLNSSFFLHTDHLTGLLSLEFGDIEAAIADFESALTFMAKAGECPVPYAHAAHDAARAYMARAAPGDEERARALTEESLAIAQRLGMKPLIEKIVALKVKMQGLTSDDMGSSIDRVVTTVHSERPNLSVHAAPDGMVTLMFSDIENSTLLNEQMGDAKWMEVLRAHNTVIERVVNAHHGHVVKTMGDGYMVAFKSAADGLRCAITIQKALSEPRSAMSVVRVRIGLHTGEMVREGDDFFGRHVNLAARVAGQAGGGEILVSGVVRELVSGLPFAFDDLGERPMKGFEQPVRVWSARWS